MSFIVLRSERALPHQHRINHEHFRLAHTIECILPFFSRLHRAQFQLPLKQFWKHEDLWVLFIKNEIFPLQTEAAFLVYWRKSTKKLKSKGEKVPLMCVLVYIVKDSLCYCNERKIMSKKYSLIQWHAHNSLSPSLTLFLFFDLPQWVLFEMHSTKMLSLA